MKKAGLSELVMFDNDRNMTRGKAPNGTLQRFEYDEAGRVIVTKTDAGVAIETNTYGTSRERLKKETGTDAGAKRTYYAWGGTSVICEYSETGSQATMGWSKAYVYAGSRLLSTSTKNGATEKLEYHHPDRLGTKLVSDSVGGTFKEQATLPFGTSIDSEMSGVSGSGSSGTGAPSNRRVS